MGQADDLRLVLVEGEAQLLGKGPELSEALSQEIHIGGNDISVVGVVGVALHPEAVFEIVVYGVYHKDGGGLRDLRAQAEAHLSKVPH